MKKYALISIVIILLNVHLATNANANAIEGVYSLEFHSIGENGDNPFVFTEECRFDCYEDYCKRGYFSCGIGEGGGEWLSFGSLFYANWSGKFGMAILSGIYFNRVMFGFGNVFFGSIYFTQPTKYECWFIGKKIK